MSHLAFHGRLAALSALVLGAAGVTAPAPARAQGMPPAPPAAGQVAPPPPAAAPPPAGAMPPAYAPPPGYQPPPQSAPPGYGYPPPGYGYPPPGYGYPPPGYGYPPPVVQGPPSVHDGFFLHMGFGFGYLHLESNTTTIAGGGAGFALAMGGTIAPNLIIHGLFAFISADQPTVRSGGSSVTATGSVATASFGPGLTYYFPDANVYLMGTVLASQWAAFNRSNDQTGETNWGVGFHAQIGKEWWVSENWGLGLAGMFISSSMTDDVQRWTALSGSLMFSATYN